MLDVDGWRKMKTVGQLRYEQGLAVESNKDSAYGKQVVRKRKKFSKLKLPKRIEANLPFATM